MPLPAPSRQPTQREVAQRAGVSLATVSYSLRNDPRIPAETQQRVRAAAESLGYRPDPVLSALVARQTTRRKRRSAANIAALIDDRWHATRSPHWHQAFIDGMQAASERLGYSLDLFHIERDLGSTRNPDRILHGRGIRGLIILPLYDQDITLRLQWDRYATIAIDNPPPSLPLHRVGSDGFLAMQITCERLWQLGYRRIGLANSHVAEQRLRYEWIGGMSKEMFLPQPRMEIAPPYLAEDFGAKGLLAWVKREKPDAIVSNFEGVIHWLRDAGYRLPQDIGVALLNLNHGPLSNAAGISQHLDVHGETAVEQLHTLLLRGETGFPPVPKEVLLRPKWNDGFTLRSLKSAAV